VPIITSIASTPFASQWTAIARSAAGSIAETAERFQAALPSRGQQATTAPPPIAGSVAAAPGSPAAPAAAAAPALAPAPAAPVPETLELSLGALARARLAPPADSIGLTLTARVVKNQYSGRLYRVTELGNGAVKRWLVQGPPTVLRDPSPDNRDRLSMLLFAFAPDDKLYFMAEEVDAAAFAVQNLVEKLWKPRYGAIVPWSQINVLSNMPLGDQVDFLRSKFDLEGVEAAPDESPNLTTNDIDLIAMVLVEFGDFLDVAGRQSLILQAGLRDVASEVDLQGAARTVAYNLLFQLRRKPKLTTGGTALGALIGVLIKRDTVPPDDVTRLTEIRDRYGL